MRGDKVLGIGLCRTGTGSLLAALSALGYTPALQHPWTINSIVSARAAVDLSVAFRFKVLTKLFPEAKFIYTYRPLEDWLRSCEVHWTAGPATGRQLQVGAVVQLPRQASAERRLPPRTQEHAMRIDAITCCVGPIYASYLVQSLPVWADTLDSLIVVTKPGDVVLSVCKPYGNVRVVETDIFTRHGARFNKGAALCVAYHVSDPQDVALHFDSDILPPTNWRVYVENRFRNGTISGCRRQDENGNIIHDAPPHPYGFFQVWHAKDPVLRTWPIFEPWHPHCGSYDIQFQQQWGQRQRGDFGFRVTHFGEVRQNWFGVGLSPEAQAESYRAMMRLHDMGLHHVRANSIRNTPGSRVQHPPPRLRLNIQSGNRERNWELLRACRTHDPFLLHAHTGPPERGDEIVGVNVTPEELRTRVLEELLKWESEHSSPASATTTGGTYV